MSWFEDTLNLLSPGWVGSLIGLAGFIGAVVVYFLTRKRTSLSYGYLAQHLLGSSSDALPPQITVQFNGNPIPRLTRTVIVLWNSGENTLLGSDIVQSDRLRFHGGTDGEVLSISVLKASRVVNEFTVHKASSHAPNEAVMDFNFLDANDGAVVEILHTSEERKPVINGTIRGLPKGLKSFGRINKTSSLKINIDGSSVRAMRLMLSSISTWVPIALGTLMALIGFLMTTDLIQVRIPIEESKNLPSTPLILAGIGYACLGFFSLYSGRRRYPKCLHIEALE
ncbi:hypothetical protein PMI26_01830 [Pseudomonas sp. GM33]|uniref:hypothetical protein n=1 Tax=Pseudomonas sp. GM33 TaxID=1144329 RepID=UPI00027022F4|nr:hypothetical protein [Pseudomonas sp. GM33]EJM44831.1 hypothetical protein PMI26_01830 [Pseudomonas sp. GM33]